MSNDNFINIDYDKLKIIQESLREGLDGLNNLPQHAMNAFITHYDYAVLMMTIKAVVDSLLKEPKEGEL